MDQFKKEIELLKRQIKTYEEQIERQKREKENYKEVIQQQEDMIQVWYSHDTVRIHTVLMSLKKKQTFKQRDNVVPYKKAVNHQIFKEDLYFSN